MTTPQTKIMLNLSLWILFALVRILLTGFVNDGVRDYTTLIDRFTTSSFLIAAVLVFFGFGVVNRKSKSNKNKDESAKAMDLTLSEISSVLMNVGGLAVAILLLELVRVKNFWSVNPQSFWSLLSVGILMYVLSYYLMPSEPQNKPANDI